VNPVLLQGAGPDDVAVWYLLAKQFADNEYVVFDLQNEPNGIDASVVFDCEQAAIFAIRAAGATSQLILLEGTSWTGAWSQSSSLLFAPCSCD
jgi:endoglucanase